MFRPLKIRPWVLFCASSFVLGAFAALPSTADATNRYWVGTAGGNTNDTANWASTIAKQSVLGWATNSSDVATPHRNDSQNRTALSRGFGTPCVGFTWDCRPLEKHKETALLLEERLLATPLNRYCPSCHLAKHYSQV